MPGPNDDDRKQLFIFLVSTRDFVGKHIESGRDSLGTPVIDEDMLPLLRDAWKEFQDGPGIAQAEKQIFGVSDQALIEAGLYGAQLRLKLENALKHRDNYQRRGGPKFLRKAIDAFDHLLDSLIKATGAGEALKELKDILGDNVKGE